MLPEIPKEGERVMFLPFRIKGTITYVDHRNIYNHHLYPIQVELDEPWDPPAPQRMIRGNMLEFRKLKKKKKVKK